MALGISDFSQVAQMKGEVRLDGDRQSLQATGKGFGKLIAWFQGKLNPGQRADDNKAVMNAFVRAIAADPKYGRDFANSVRQSLNPQIEAGAPLTARQIKTVLNNLDNRALIDDDNKLRASRFASGSDPNDPNGFSRLLTNALADKDPGGRLTGINTQPLSNQISKAILDLGAKGSYRVMPPEAKAIALEKINTFIDSQLYLLDQLEELGDLNESDASSVCNYLLQQGDVKAGHLGKAVNQVHYQKATDKLDSLLAASAEKYELGDLLEHIDTSKLQNALTTALADADEPLTSADAKRLAEEAVDGFMKAKKAIVDSIDQRSLSTTAKTALKQLVLSEPTLKNSARVDAMLELSHQVGEMAKGLGQARTHGDMVRQLGHLMSEFHRTSAIAFGDDGGADDFFILLQTAVDAWSATQSDLDDPSLQQLFDVLNGKTMGEVRDGCLHMAMKQNLLGDFMLMSTAISMLGKTIGEHLDLDEGLIQAVQNPPLNMKKLSDVPDAVIAYTRDQGHDLDLPDPIGRQAKDTFGQHFTTQYLNGLNQELGKTTHTFVGDIKDAMIADFRRSTFIAGDKEINNVSKEESIKDMKAFFGEDTAGLKAVSSVTHQGLFADIFSNLANAETGPFQGALTFTDNRQIYEIDRASDGGYQVRATFNAKPNTIFNTTTMQQQALAPSDSHFQVSVTFQISRASIDNGTPQATLVGGIDYNYLLTPQQ